MCYPPFEDVRSRVEEALRCFYLNDSCLVHIGAHERSMTFRLGMYLQLFFSGWDVDCEYNRKGTRPKTNSKNRKVLPDVIIHHRNTPENLLAIEAKPPHASQDKINEAKDKIMEYVWYKLLRYRFGLFIEFKDNFENTYAGLQWCRLGENRKPHWYDNNNTMIEIHFKGNEMRCKTFLKKRVKTKC